ncbi:Prophage CP4-57 regulatory protein (AlpA) [compost metagenome]
MKILRLKDVIDITGLSRSTLYLYIAEGRFPKPVSLGDRCVGWVESEVHDWILARIAERDEGKTLREPIGSRG